MLAIVPRTPPLRGAEFQVLLSPQLATPFRVSLIFPCLSYPLLSTLVP
jgi:hypothetical protein